MILLILGIYIFIGVVSAFSNFGKWIFSSPLLAIPLLPFMIIYYLIRGDSVKLAEAVSLSITLVVLFVISFIIVISIQTMLS